MRLRKYHGLGNDYLVLEPVDAGREPDADLARAVCERNRGVGADGLLYGPFKTLEGFGLRIFNPDGSEAERSGNGIRIFAWHLWARGLASSRDFAIAVGGGLVKASIVDADTQTVRLDLGEPDFACERIPVLSAALEFIEVPALFDGRACSLSAVSMGNPHCVVRGLGADEAIARSIGPLVETDPRFPKRSNVQFLEVISPQAIRIQIWERGAGYTLASGTSACAAAAVAHRLGLVGDSVEVRMSGGSLWVRFSEGHALLTGPVEFVCDLDWQTPRQLAGGLGGSPSAGQAGGSAASSEDAAVSSRIVDSAAGSASSRQALLAEAKALSRELSEIRRRLHAMPELGLEEHRSADYICARLDELGIDWTRRGTAIVGLIHGEREGACVALRADMDALPIQEATGAPYASTTPGRMHACGHDAHCAILLGAARLLAARRATFAGGVKLLFQPAEETEGGALDMISSGCLEDPHVDAVYGLHVMPYLQVGQVETRRGPLFGSSATLDITVRGRSCHGAYPETGVDAIAIAAQLIQALHAIIPRSVSPLAEAVFTIGTIQGGARSNIVADEVRMSATLRTSDDAVRDAFIERAKALSEGLPAAWLATGSLGARYGYVALVNHDAGVDAVARNVAALLGPEALRWKEKPSLAVEDFSYFLKERPGAFYFLGSGNAARGIDAPLHSPHFDIDEDCLPLGAALQACLALDALGAFPEVASS